MARWVRQDGKSFQPPSFTLHHHQQSAMLSPSTTQSKLDEIT
jgi:hypothetical protein